MLTIADIRNAANAFPESGTAEELINKLLLLYKVEMACRKQKKEKGFRWLSATTNRMTGGNRSGYE
jgi:hypothetical protein